MECYNALSDRAKNGKYKGLIDQKLSRAKKYEEHLAAKESGLIAVGKTAPEFTLPSIDGTEKSLSDFRGKWVILDFWGSWCGWCIKGIPDMKEFYAQHSNKVEIVGIACNDTDEKWRECVAANKLNWTNLFDTQNLSGKYAIDGFPTKILIDPDGTIQLICQGESADHYTAIAKAIN